MVVDKNASSYDIINSISGMDKIVYYILHHEILTDQDIPKPSTKNEPAGSRIMHVADAFDANDNKQDISQKKRLAESFE